MDLNQVEVIFGIGNPAKYGDQVTGGSSTIRGSYERLLRLSASAREMLIEAAAKKWGVPRSQCYAEAGSVIHHDSRRKLGYGDLVADASKLKVPATVALKDLAITKSSGSRFPNRQPHEGKWSGCLWFR